MLDGRGFWVDMPMTVGRLITPKMALERSMFFSRMTGFGHFELAEYSPERLVFRSSNSTIAQTYERTTRPVCLFVAAMLAGRCEALFRRPNNGIETGCVAESNADC